MTTISIRPVREARERNFWDSSTFDHYQLGKARVVSSNTLMSLGDATVYTGREFEGRSNRGQELLNTKWFNPTLQAVAALPWRTDNWTSGGTRTQLAAVAKMLSLLAKILDNRTPPPNVVPTWRGGVQVEWHRNSVYLEIEVDPHEEMEYFFKSSTEENEGVAWSDLDRLTEYVRALTE